MKLWQKNTTALAEVERFTVGQDRDFDLMLAPFDVLGSIAHVRMLATVGLLEAGEAALLVNELRKIYSRVKEAAFRLEDGVEDIHSQVELMLTRALGDAGKKIHSARSRNDQVLVDIKLFLRDETEGLVKGVLELFTLLQELSERHKEDLLPGYTHLQLAMPSPFGLWFGAYAEGLSDDLLGLQSAWNLVNKNPLGSAAGYGSSFPINRNLTTKLLGFSDLHYNVVYAQMTRGKTERVVAGALAGIAATLARLSMDACLYLNPQFGFISFPDELTTGSSIMPHKKNPDVFELIRARCNRLQALPNEIALITSNLPSGYHRDLQLLKEHLFPAFRELQDCIRMTLLMLSHVSVRKDLLTDPKFQYLFSVEEVNRLVLQGVPFRDAYKQVGVYIEQGTYRYSTDLKHTHEGSIGNLCNDKIKMALEQVVAGFGFEAVHSAVGELLQDAAM